VYFRFLKVAISMFLYLIKFTWRRLVGVKNQDAILDQDYRIWSRYFLDVFDIQLKVIGRENIPDRVATNTQKSNLKSRKLVIMSNHQSQLDIPSLVTAMDCRVGFVAKRELGRIPMLGFFMSKVGCVFIDRSDSRSAHKVLEKAAQEMGFNPLVVFPEGTRSKDGKILPLKQGGCRLALLADALILPVLIQGTRDAAENRKPNSRIPIPVTLRMFPVLDTRELQDGKAAFVKIKDYLESCWQSPSEPI
jgi:1-acyl-sn-glycerol-3-phosphate acyltransferase